MELNHKFKLNESQLRKLKVGKTVRLKPGELDGDVVVVLTGDQVCRLRKARRLQKGFDVKFIEPQEKQNRDY